MKKHKKAFSKNHHIKTSVFLTAAIILITFSAISESNAMSSAATKNQKPITTPAFLETADFDPAIPSPESIIGFPVGQKAVHYDQLINYLKALDKSSDIISLNESGQTYEGRTLYHLIITSKANHRKIEGLKADNARIADPRKIKSDSEAEKLIENSPAVAFLNYSIHGDELSSTDAALYIIYHLAASRDRQTKKLLDELIIIINPLMNPDGRERFLGQIFQMTGAVENPDLQAMHHTALWSRGRGNHYLFDMNRNWLTLNFPEVIAVSGIVSQWNPQLLVDSHEMGPEDTYLFDPPAEPVNIHLSESITKWRKLFGSEQAKAFNKYGWSYYTRDWYSDWGPIYTNSYANLIGAIGILYEQARANSSLVKKQTGKIMLYHDTVHHHIVSTFSNLQTLCDNRKQILREFYEDRKLAITKQKQDKVFILPPDKDNARWRHFVELVKNHSIEIQFAQSDFEAENATGIWGCNIQKRKFPAGSVIIKPDQPLRRLLLNMLEFDPRLNDDFLLKERKELENRRDTLLYDTSAWSLPLCFGLQAFWAENITDAKPASIQPQRKPKTLPPAKPNFGYIIDFSTAEIYPALVKFFDNNCHPRVATEPFTFEGKKYQHGTVLLCQNENPDNLSEILLQISKDFEIDIHPADTALVEDGPDLGSSKFELLTAPKIAIASQWPISSTSFGSIWFLIDNQLKIKSSPVNIQNINRIDLRTYNLLVLPESRSLNSVLNDRAIEKIKGWVEDGGTLIAVGSSAAFFADEDKDISSVRLRRDVLDKLDEYTEAVQKERAARDIKIDPNTIWNFAAEEKTEDPNKKNDDKSAVKGDIEKLKRDDQWKRIFSPHGTFLSTKLNPENWLAFGLDEKLPIFFSGNRCFMSKYPVATPVRMAESESLRISGLLWPEARERIADSAYATVESVGRGQVILFVNDPTFRMWLPGVQRLLKNAVLLGPGMGTSQPRPW